MRTVIHGGDVVAYHDGGHRLLRGGSLVYEDDRVVFVGRSYAGASDHRIDATGKLVIPGLVNLHCHATTEASGRLIADAGRRDFFHTGFLNYQSAPRGMTPMAARENLDIGNRFALVELLRNGCTTIVELGAVNDATVAFAGPIGIRAYLTPGYRSASYRVGPEGRLEYEWDEEAGMRGLERAKAFIGAHQGAHAGRIRGMLYPLQVDTCSPELFRATRKRARVLPPLPRGRRERGAGHRHLSARSHQRDAVGVAPVQGGGARLHRGHRRGCVQRGHACRRPRAAPRRPRAPGPRRQG